MTPYIITIAALSLALFVSAARDIRANKRHGRSWYAMGPVEPKTKGQLTWK